MQVRKMSERSSAGSSDSVSSSTNSQLFPKHCFICKKDRIQYNKKDEYPHLIKTKIGEVPIKLDERCQRFVMRTKMKTLLHESLNVTNHATINSGLMLLGLMTFLITQSLVSTRKKVITIL